MAAIDHGHVAMATSEESTTQDRSTKAFLSVLYDKASW